MDTSYTLDKKIEKILATYQKNISLASQAYQREILEATEDLKERIIQKALVNA